MTLDEKTEVFHALEMFVHFLDWIDASVELGGISPVTDDSIVTSLNTCGGSTYLRIEHFRKAKACLVKYHPSNPETTT